MKHHLPKKKPLFPASTALLAALLAFPVPVCSEELPRKAPLGRYAGLWNNSPFTSEPEVEAPEPIPVDNPLDDYALTGVSPVAGGYRVTMINRNDTSKRIVVNTARESDLHDFEVVNINRTPGRPLSTTVEVTDGTHTGTLAFEQELLTLRTPPAAAPEQPDAPPGVDAGRGQQERAQGGRRAPRPRVVPQGADAQQQQRGQRGQRGQANPGTSERADRRGRRR